MRASHGFSSSRPGGAQRDLSRCSAPVIDRGRAWRCGAPAAPPGAVSLRRPRHPPRQRAARPRARSPTCRAPAVGARVWLAPAALQGCPACAGRPHCPCTAAGSGCAALATRAELGPAQHAHAPCRCVLLTRLATARCRRGRLASRPPSSVHTPLPRSCGCRSAYCPPPPVRLHLPSPWLDAPVRRVWACCQAQVNPNPRAPCGRVEPRRAGGPSAGAGVLTEAALRHGARPAAGCKGLVSTVGLPMLARHLAGGRLPRRRCWQLPPGRCCGAADGEPRGAGRCAVSDPVNNPRPAGPS
jgi:hypothetical protein